MYASNEDEYNRDDNDWVFLRQTPPLYTVQHEDVNLVDDEQLNLDSSSSSSDSSSSKSDRTDSVSSVSSIEHEPIQSNNQTDEQENHLLNENPVIPSHIDDDDNNDSLPTGEGKEDVLSSEMMVKQMNENETTPVINEYDLFNGGFDLSNEPMSSENNLRHRTGTNVQQTVDEYPLSIEYERPLPPMRYSRFRRNNAFILCGFVLVFFTSQLLFIRFMSTQQLVITQITDELNKVNQRLDELQMTSPEEISQKLTQQFEAKFQKLINEKMIEYNHEKYSLVLQINELYHIINHTKQNLTNTVHQLAEENVHLHEQIITLERRLQIAEEQNSKERDSCPPGIDCTKSSTSSLDVLLDSLIKQTTSVAKDTSVNLSGLFEQLSASISDLVDNSQEYVEESKKKLTDFAGSETAEKVQHTIRRGVENLSSSIRKAQSTYTTWLRSRAEQREQARKASVEKEQNTARRPWRWTFQRSQDRERMRYETPKTQKYSSNKESVCYSQYEFPANQLCSMKNWMGKFFRP